MRLELLKPFLNEVSDPDVKREIGAVVARATPTGGVEVEFGPADGAALLRMVLSTAEATRLCATFQAIINGRDEEIVITEP